MAEVLEDPIISEFETQSQAESYDRWFRAKVHASLADTRPTIPHEQVMAQMEAIIAKAERQRALHALNDASQH
jgi:hypothetical protein